MRRYFFLSIILMIIVLFIGCQGRSLVYQSDTRPSVQTALIITSKPSRAQVEIDGEYLGVTPIRLGGTKVGIDPGERTVVISSGEGYSLETVIEGKGSLFREPDLEYYSVFRQEDRLLIEEGKVLPHHVAFEVDEVELTVEADTGWSFHKWEGDVKGSDNPIRFVMDEEKRVTAVLTYTVSGKIVDDFGIPMDRVAISFSGDYEGVTTGEDGEWNKEGLRGKVMVTPSKDGYGFIPETSEVEGPSTEVNFSWTYRVSGRIIDEESQGIKGVKMAFSGEYSSVTTDSDGRWSKDGLTGSVTVTPSKRSYGFTPETREMTGPANDIHFTAYSRPEAEDQAFHSVEGIDFFMRLAPAATFPVGSSDSYETIVDNDFWIAETPVTYELWYEVRKWALKNGYTFANDGREGSQGETGEAPSKRRNEPVTEVNWYDSIVWCNALSEIMGYDPVYMIDGAVIKNATGISHAHVAAESRDGFRLPTLFEWELAARYKGSDSSYGAIEHPLGSGRYWTPGNYASGATDDLDNEEATMAAAWYRENSDIDGSGIKTQDVGQKPSSGNGLGLYDMSGNVREWSFSPARASRYHRGGSYASFGIDLQVGYLYLGTYPRQISPSMGFRFVQTSGPIIDHEEIVYIPADPGEETSHQADGVHFNMRLAPAATFPTGLSYVSGQRTVDDDFWIAETQVTYELWYTVRVWAEGKGYAFANDGQEGSHGEIGEAPSSQKNEPVTTVNWYDSIVWCNALSEMLGFDPVYRVAGEIVRDAKHLTDEELHSDVVAEANDGFRLPTREEWELGARYRGSDSSYGAIEYPAGSGKYWTPGNYASGATASIYNAGATRVAAWHTINSDVDGSGRKTQDVGQKPPNGNGLGVFDMSGNVDEWGWSHGSNQRPPRFGGFYGSSPQYIRARSFDSLALARSAGSSYGLRFVRTRIDPPKTKILTMKKTGQGTLQPWEGHHEYDEGSVVNIKATPSEGWNFTEWVGDVESDENPMELTMDNHKTVTAIFEEDAGSGYIPDIGEQSSHTTLEGLTFYMRLAPASTFPTEVDDSGEATIDDDFWVAETQVTYELWYEVRDWALKNGYTFDNLGREGGDYENGNVGGSPTMRKNEPVTSVNWYDCIVWCNALSEMLGFDPVYRVMGETVRDSEYLTDEALHEAVVLEENNGFRLPTSMEWELAARYKGSDSSHGAIEYPAGSGDYWTPGNYASGATGPAWNPKDEEATKEAAWYWIWIDGTGNTTKTQDVGQKPPYGNGLGIFDMSGNVWEWCFTQSGPYPDCRVSRGGSWSLVAGYLQVGHVYAILPDSASISTGFRLMRRIG